MVEAFTTWRQLHLCGIAGAIGEHDDSLFRIAVRMHQDLLGSVGAETSAFPGIQLLAVGICNVVNDAPYLKRLDPEQRRPRSCQPLRLR